MSKDLTSIDFKYKLTPLIFSTSNQLENIKRMIVLDANKNQIVMDTQGNSFFLQDVLSLINWCRIYDKIETPNQYFLCSDGRTRNLKELAKIDEKTLVSDYFFKNQLLLYLLSLTNLDSSAYLSVISQNDFGYFPVFYKKKKDKFFYSGFLDAEKGNEVVPSINSLSYITPNLASMSLIQLLVTQNAPRLTPHIAQKKVEVLEEFILELAKQEKKFTRNAIIKCLAFLPLLLSTGVSLEGICYLGILALSAIGLSLSFVPPNLLVLIGVAILVGTILSTILFPVVALHYRNEVNEKKSEYDRLKNPILEFKSFLECKSHTMFGQTTSEVSMSDAMLKDEKNEISFLTVEPFMYKFF